jgi:photosystem II stability/assembly factor-like uncharacterized protein
MMKKSTILLAAGLVVLATHAFAQSTKKNSTTEKKSEDVSMSGLKFRSVGPALTSGRIADIAVHPSKPWEYFVAVASGGIWKTTNAGTTFEPIFDGEGSFSIGCVSIDPQNPNIVWVGTGENNNQRSVAYGDGVYKSVDGGKSWKNMGLKTSEHIGSIRIHPQNSNIVYVAAIGPLWSPGGERGVYKSTDGGNTWEQSLKLDEHTGVNDVEIDPKNPSVLYATAYQRRRHTYTFVSGGPGSALYKSIDAGKTWEKAQKGLPSVELGRMDLAISPADPTVFYLIVEAAKGEGGFYRSTNEAASWEKRSSHKTSGNYYSEIVADPTDKDKVYSLDTWMWVSTDGGKQFKHVGEKHKHVDNHALWINPANTLHLLSGCDGGLYESWDGAATWQYKPNLPVTQFYKVEVDNSSPFYYIYGGTQDNFSLGGPSRTRNESGITNADWFVTNGGDGFESQIDPYNTNIVYAQSQYGGLVRYDKATGEITGIQPKPGVGQKAFRWNWDAPLQVSRHQKGRVYFAANFVFRSDDYGNTWKTISPDLSLQLDRNKLPVYGRILGVDAVSKNESTSPYGAVIGFSESPKNANLLYAGTDDGLIQVTTDGGGSWRRVESFPGVPTRTYVYQVLASQHSEQVVYASFNNHKMGDFKPYLFRSADKGVTWTPIMGNLPVRGSTYAMAEDHLDPDLLFVGTEFGVFFTRDGGKNWIQLKAGLPTIAVRDIAIQQRENDLVLASFGRGFYVLDDYSPLRSVHTAKEKEAHLFPVKDSWMYIENSPLGIRGKAFMGESFYRADNPPVGAVFTYFVREESKSLKKVRQEAEDKLNKDGKDVGYPSYEALKKEEEEPESFLLLTIRNEQGEAVRQIKTSVAKGVHRTAWDFKYPSSNPVSIAKRADPGPFDSEDAGQYVIPGTYSVTLSRVQGAEEKVLAGPEKFVVKLLPGTTLPATDRPAMLAWQREAAEMQRAMQAATRTMDALQDKVKHMREALHFVLKQDATILADILAVEQKLKAIGVALKGDAVAAKLDIDQVPSVSDRFWSALYDGWGSTSDPTATMKEQLKLASEEFKPVLAGLQQLVDATVPGLEKRLEQLGAPYTPGRRPDWMRK